MNTKELGFRPGLLGLVLVMVWQSSHAQVRDGRDFLSTLGNVEVPAPVITEDTSEATVPAPRPPAGRGQERKQESDLTARILADNRRLKAQLTRQAQKMREQEASVHGGGQVQLQSEPGPQLSALRRQLTEQTSVLKAAEAARDSLSQEVKQLRLKNHALLVKTDVTSLTATSEPVPSAALKQNREALARAEQQLSGQSEEVRQAKTQTGTLTRSLAALQKKYDALSAERDELRGRVDAGQKQMAILTALRDTLLQKKDEQTKRAKDVADATQQKDVTLNKQLTALMEAQAALRSQLAEASQRNEALTKQVAVITGERDTLQQTLTKSERRMEALTQQMSALKAGALQPVNAAGQDIVALQKQLAGMQEKNTALKAEGETASKQVFTLQEKVNTLTQQLAALNAPQDKALPVTDRKKSELTTDAQRQTYASGVVFADNLKRTLALQKNLGITSDPDLLLAGLTDAMQGTVRLDATGLDTSYHALIKRLTSLEEKKYQEGEKTLEKLASGPSLLKRNRSMFFVQKRKGEERIRPGDRVKFDMAEAVVKGRMLRDTKGMEAVLDDKLPYLVGQALTLAGRGGSVVVYCMASDVYSPEQLPPGLFAYSLLKYTLTVDGE